MRKFLHTNKQIIEILQTHTASYRKMKQQFTVYIKNNIADENLLFQNHVFKC